MTLEYHLASLNRYDTFDQAPPWRGLLGAWEFLLSDMHLQARSGERFANVAQARASLEPLLRAWEAKAFLDGGYELTFRFDGDPNEPTPGAEAEEAFDSGDRIYRRANGAYPAPDPTFQRTPLVEHLLEQINRFRRGEMSLPAVAANVVHELRTMAGGSTDPGVVATALGTERRVLDKVAELAARGQPAAATDDRPASYRGPEWQWLQEALRRLTLQAGRAADGPPQTPLELDDFETQL